MAVRNEGALHAAMERMLAADCPWGELSNLVEERRQQHAAQGGDDFTLACAIAYYVVGIEMPVKKAVQK